MSAAGDCDGILCPTCKGSGRVPIERAHIGLMVAVRRHEAGMTQEEMAAKVGISRAQIANMESGRSDLPVSRLQKYADALGVKMKDLFP